MKTLVTMLALLPLSRVTAAQGVPTTVPVSARVLESGAPVDGPIAVRFSLWDAASGGSEVWSEPEITLDAQAGFVSHALGLVTPIDEKLLAGEELFVQLRVGGVDMGQRVAIRSVPYAVRAGFAGYAGELGAPTSAARVRVDDGKLVARPNLDVTSTTTPFVTTSATFVDVPGQQVAVVTHGNPVMLTVSTNLNVMTGNLGSYNSWAAFTLTRNGENLGSANGLTMASHSINDNLPISFSYIDTAAPAGENVYRLQVRAGEASVKIQLGEGNTPQQISAHEMN
jgi:hypothetical protein